MRVHNLRRGEPLRPREAAEPDGASAGDAPLRWPQDGQAGRRAGGQAGRRAGGQAGRRAGGQAGRRAGGQAGRRAGGQAGRRAGGQAGRRPSSLHGADGRGRPGRRGHRFAPTTSVGASARRTTAPGRCHLALGANAEQPTVDFATRSRRYHRSEGPTRSSRLVSAPRFGFASTRPSRSSRRRGERALVVSSAPPVTGVLVRLGAPQLALE